MKKKKKFRLFDAILATVCITLVAESVMPTAAIGNSQYFWWIFLIIAFCIPLLFSSHSRRKSIGEIVLGFSLLFIGLDGIEANENRRSS